MSMVSLDPHYSVGDYREGREADDSQMPFRGTFFSSVVNADPVTESLVLDSAVGQQTTHYPYPFNSSSAWIRGQPESGSTLLSLLGADSKRIHPIAYYDPLKGNISNKYNNHVKEIKANTSFPIPQGALPYRVLHSADIDLGSGSNQLYLSKSSSVASLRGGFSHLRLKNKSSEFQTPTLSVKGAHNELSGELNDEYRFGVVRRNVSLKSDDSPLKQDGEFAKEFSYNLRQRGAQNPLVDHREGNVLDDNGKVVVYSPTKNPLRSRVKYFSKDSPRYLLEEIDNQGNMGIRLPATATDGLRILTPNGSFMVESGSKVQMSSTDDMSFISDTNIAVSAGGNYQSTIRGRWKVVADRSAEINSSGVVSLKSSSQYGIHLGGARYPVAIVHPAYLTSMTQMLTNLLAYVGSAGAAFGALSVASLGGSAGVIPQAGLLAQSISTHLTTLQKGQFISSDILGT